MALDCTGRPVGAWFRLPINQAHIAQPTRGIEGQPFSVEYISTYNFLCIEDDWYNEWFW